MKKPELIKVPVLILMAASFTACKTDQKKTNKEVKPNFVVIFSDEMDPNYLQSYNEKSIHPTPNITELAEEGTLFTNAYTTSPMCTPSRFSILTGKYPGRCSTDEFMEEYPYDKPYSVAWNTRIDKPTRTIANYLSEAGYVTGMAGKWHVGDENPDIPDIPQFSAEDELTDPEVNEKLKKHHEIFRNLLKETAGFDYANSVSWSNFDNFPFKKLAFHNIPWITRGAALFLDDRAKDKKPFFLYVAPTAVHGPAHQESLDRDPTYTLEGKVEDVRNYDIDKSIIKEQIKDIPDPDRHKFVGLAYTDKLVGDILKKLEDNNQMENTVVIFMADHNVEPGKATCYEKGNKVPLIVKWPGKATSYKSDNFIQSIDLVKTMIESASVDDPLAEELDGMNVLGLMEENAEQVRESIYLESGYARGIRVGDYKYISFRLPEDVVNAMKNEETEYAPNYLNTYKQAHSQIAIEYFPHYFDQDQLYNLEEDPYELKNLAYKEEYRNKLNEMKQELEDYLEKFRHPYDLQRIPFLESEEYKELTENTRDIGTGFIKWLPRDHGKIKYPPERN